MNPLNLGAKQPHTFGQRLRYYGSNNNFDALRLLAAGMVVFSHAFLLGADSVEREPLYWLTRGAMNSGSLAVAAFFVISGFLIAKSYADAESATVFLLRRCLRILPALFMVVILSAFVLGPAVSELSLAEYFSRRAPYEYPFRCFNIQLGLPGVFLHNPYPVTVNGSLWTLRLEIACYLLVLVLGTAKALGWQSLLAVLVLGLSGRCLLDWVPGGASLDPYFAYRNLCSLVAYFAAGGLLYVLREWVPQRASLAAIAAGLTALATAAGGAVFSLAFALAGSYALIWLALSRRVRLRRWGRYGDFSYGVYIFSFPLQQLVVTLDSPAQPWWLNLLYSLPLIALAAFASWHCVEKHALSLKQVVGKRVRREPRLERPD